MEGFATDETEGGVVKDRARVRRLGEHGALKDEGGGGGREFGDVAVVVDGELNDAVALHVQRASPLQSVEAVSLA